MGICQDLVSSFFFNNTKKEMEKQFKLPLIHPHIITINNISETESQSWNNFLQVDLVT